MNHLEGDNIKLKMSKYDVATLLEKFVSNLRNNLEKFSLGNQVFILEIN